MTPDNFRKAAILVATLDASTADTVLDSVPEEQAARVRRMIVGLGELDAAEQDAVIDEFFRAAPRGSLDQTDDAEPDALRDDERHSDAPRDGVEFIVSSPATGDDAPARPFGFLDQARGDKLSPLLAGERPQTIALVISHLPPDRAADVLGALDCALQVDVLRRLVDLDEADPNVLRDVERGLESRILEQIRHESRLATRMNAAAGIVQAAAPRQRRELLANLARHDWRLADRLRPATCAFADLERMDPETLATLLSELDPDVTLLALAAAPLGLVDRVLGQFSPQEAAQVRRTIERLGPTRLADIDEAQRRIAERARQLALDGRIELPMDRG
ncbi:MAG TPA: FliG C-terminal domain-containing protein [Pirellulales bacterium]|nr:FliG C-terminal domain-containing protein [Pirellulales bacterium]